MTIETNLQGRPVTLTLPLPASSNFAAAQRQKLRQYADRVAVYLGLDGSTALPGTAAWSDVTESYWAYEAVRAASVQR